MMGIMVAETCWANNKICNKNHLLHLVGILFPHINVDAMSKPYQIHTAIPIFYLVLTDSATWQCHEPRQTINVQPVRAIFHSLSRNSTFVPWSDHLWSWQTLLSEFLVTYGLAENRSAKQTTSFTQTSFQTISSVQSVMRIRRNSTMTQWKSVRKLLIASFCIPSLITQNQQIL